MIGTSRIQTNQWFHNRDPLSKCFKIRAGGILVHKTYKLNKGWLSPYRKRTKWHIIQVQRKAESLVIGATMTPGGTYWGESLLLKTGFLTVDDLGHQSTVKAAHSQHLQWNAFREIHVHITKIITNFRMEESNYGNNSEDTCNKEECQQNHPERIS